MGEGENDGLKLDFDNHLMVQFRGAKVKSDAVLRRYERWTIRSSSSRKADDLLTDSRTGKNIRHKISGLLREK